MAGIFTPLRKICSQIPKTLSGNIRGISHLVFHGESPEDIQCRYECFFNRTDIDMWEVRQGMNDIMGHDFVPDPKVIIAGLLACRRINDYAMTVRWLEACKEKCGLRVDKFWPYIVQEIGPTVCELGCDLPEQIGYDKPELFLPSVFDV